MNATLHQTQHALQCFATEDDSSGCKISFSMDNQLDTYSGRLAAAMAEAGFTERGAQSRLGREIGSTSQAVSQAVGGNIGFGAKLHVRVCIRLGIRPLWLSEGRGLRYDPAGPRPVIAGADAPFTIPQAWLDGLTAEQGADVQVGELKAADLDWPEQALIKKLRSSSRLFEAVATLVELADVAKG